MRKRRAIRKKKQQITERAPSAKTKQEANVIAQYNRFERSGQSLEKIEKTEDPKNGMRIIRELQAMLVRVDPAMPFSFLFPSSSSSSSSLSLLSLLHHLHLPPLCCSDPSMRLADEIPKAKIKPKNVEGVSMVLLYVLSFLLAVKNLFRKRGILRVVACFVKSVFVMGSKNVKFAPERLDARDWERGGNSWCMV